jgi:PAS domain S-box-containing protein
MAAASPSLPQPRRRTHRMVEINYLIRTFAFAYAFMVLALHGWQRELGMGFWIALPLMLLAYPHIAYFFTSRAERQREAETINLYVDAMVFGALVAGAHFPLWIVYGAFFSTALNATVVRGVPGAFWSVAWFGAAAAGVVAVNGFHYQPATSTLVTTLVFFGSVVYTCSIGHVVHRQNRRLAAARNDLRTGEQRYRLIAENAADLIALVDQDGRWHYASPSYEALLKPDDLEPGTDAFRRLHPDDADHARVAVLRSASTGKARELAVRLVDRDGRVRQLRMRVQPILDAGGKSTQVLLVSQDTSDLHASEEKLLLTAHALEGMTEAMVIAAADGTIVTVNRAYCDITGYSRDEVLGQSISKFRAALQPPEFFDEVYAAVQREGYWSGTTWSRRKNGAVYREWRSVRAVRDAEGKTTHYVSVFYEVTAQHPSQARASDSYQ